MLNETLSRQVIAASNDGATAEEIAEGLRIPIETVKSVLVVNNSGTEADRDINDQELSQLRKNVVRIALYGNEEKLQLDAAKFLIERDKPRKQQGPVTNIQVINSAIAESTRMYEQLRSSYAPDKQ